MALLASSCSLLIAPPLVSGLGAQESDAGWMTISQINALPYQSTSATGQTAGAEEEILSSAPPPDFSPANAVRMRDLDIYLDVTVNGELRPDMYAFQQLPSGSLVIRADDLRLLGLLPQKSATDKKGWVDLDKLENVTYLIRDGDIVDFIASDESALAPFTANLSGWSGAANLGRLDEESRAQSDLTGLLNYSLYASTGGNDFGRLGHLNGISGILEGRVSGKFGAFVTSQLLRYSPDTDDKFDSVRLDSYWQYSDEERMLTYQAGDVITRSLPWSRSTRLGGFQLRRNFSLREDLLTTPMPSINGSAALPSTVDVYINNARVATSDVPAGPYSLTNMPIISGVNDARIVVRDAMGRETVTNMAFFSAADMLGKGLVDFSLEAGLPRRNFGSKSGDYSGDFMISATARYGMTDKITTEAHTEAGKDFFNAGIGSTISLADIGSLSLAGSTSVYRGETGQQLYASLQLQRWGFYFNARTQRSFGHYNDMASVVDARARDRERDINGFFSDYYRYGTIRPPKAVNQYSLSTNLRFDPTTINVSYTEIDNWEREDSRFLSISASRNFASRVQAYVNAYIDLKDSDAYGIFGGISMSFDNKISASVNSETNHEGSSITTQVSRAMGSKVGDYGLTIRDTEGKKTRRGIDGRYRAKFATIAASIDQYNNHSWRGTAQADGALVFADGGVTPTQKIYNSFAVVNAGAPNIGIYANNNYFDKTWRNGRLVVPDLHPYRTSSIKLDVDSMPVDMLVDITEAKVRPTHGSGVVVNFATSNEAYAHVSIMDHNGRPIEAGSYARIEGSDIGFDIGYDGLGILPLEGVNLPAKLTVQLSNNRYCQAQIPGSIKSGVSAGTQALSCRPISGTE